LIFRISRQIRNMSREAGSCRSGLMSKRGHVAYIFARSLHIFDRKYLYCNRWWPRRTSQVFDLYQ